MPAVMKRIISWVKRGDNALTVGLIALTLAVTAFVCAYSARHSATCGGCDWLWCHRYTGGGSI